MKRLLLLRHAKAVLGEDGQQDHERALNKRGERSARLIGEWLRQRGITPDLVLCSTARRTRQTLDGIMPFAGTMPSIELLPALYLAGASTILERIRGVPDSAACVMAIGHNPGFELLAGLLVGQGDPKALLQLGEKYPTGALSDIQFPADRWRSVGPRLGRLEAFIRPRDLD